MKHLSSVLSFAIVAALAAQDPQAPSRAPADAAPADALQQTAARLQKTFATTAALPSCGFQAHWGPAGKTDKKEEEANNAGGGIVAINMMGATPATGDAQGTWAQNGLHVAIGDDELRFDGRTMLAKDQTRGWALRRGRFADGNEVGFVPDPQGLLAALRAMKLDVVHREAGALADRPVEIVTVTLTHDQVAELAWGDLLPTGSDLFDGGFAQVIGMAAAGNAQRPPAIMPQTTVDLALYLDPGSGLLHRVHMRSYRKAAAGFGGRMVFVAGGGGGGVRVQQAGGDDEEAEEEEEEAKEPAKGAAPQLADGLPVRSKKKQVVSDFVLDLKDHGSALLPELDDAGKALLRR